jgi:2-polyprenyl-3-methyl-5-hydroxy-6-metoxy-1,4-benzoquinol methylase
MEFVYDLIIDPDAENNTHAFALAMVGHNKTVLEVGCATGYFTKVLAERGCEVIGMEINAEAAAQAAQWAERVIVGSAEDDAAWEQVDDESVDAITFGDVLEHLQDPLATLRMARKKLKPNGFVVTSLPNIAHGDVRLSLLRGSFRYRDLGLLDRTHLRFYTVDSVRELLGEAGLAVVDTQRVMVPLFAAEFGLRREDFPQAVVDEIRSNPEYETYQFVMKSVIDDGSAAVAEMSSRLEAEGDRANAQAERIRVLDETIREQAERIAAMAEERAQLGELDQWRGRALEMEQEVGQLQKQLTEMTNRADEYGATAHRISQALEDSEREYAKLKGSASFRLTAPLRRLKGVLRDV